MSIVCESINLPAGFLNAIWKHNPRLRGHIVLLQRKVEAQSPHYNVCDHSFTEVIQAVKYMLLSV